MPNTFAFVALFSWPLVMVLLFRLLPLHTALAWSLVAAYLLLPLRAGFNFPGVPSINKDSLPAVTAMVLCLLAAQRARLDHALGRIGADGRPLPHGTSGGGLPALAGQGAPAHRADDRAQRQSRSRWLVYGLIVLVLATPTVTMLTNRDMLVFGPRVLPALTPYDALAGTGNTLIMLLPFLLGMTFLGTPQRHRTLLMVLVISAVGYSVLALYEVRMSPQLNRMTYGFFPHSFAQHLRDGFRPVVFLNHGLWLGIFLCTGVLAACALWRDALQERVRAAPFLAAALWLVLVLLVSRNLGASALALLFAPVILFATLRVQLIVAACIAGMVITYPVLRSAGVIPVDFVVRVAERIDMERAGSFRFRVIHEDRLLERASERPLAGWGSYGRNRIFDAATGRDQSVTDGAWIIIRGTGGWMGYFGYFGLLTLPTVLLALRRRRTLHPATAGLAMAGAVAMIDMLPNGTLTVISWLIAGAVAGHVLRASAPDGQTARTAYSMHPAPGFPADAAATRATSMAGRGLPSVAAARPGTLRAAAMAPSGNVRPRPDPPLPHHTRRPRA